MAMVDYRLAGPFQVQAQAPRVAQPVVAPVAGPAGGPAPAVRPSAASGDASASAAALLRRFEGFRETPYWDVNALRTGYGSDTITAADGSVRPVGQGDRVTRDDAERDLARRLGSEFIPRAQGQVGADRWNALDPNQQAALTSIAYNYGSLPTSVVAAVRLGDAPAVARAIEGLGGHNDGINRYRRNQEAAAYLGGSLVGGGGDTRLSGDAGQDTLQPVQATPAQITGAYQAFQSGQMPAEEMAQYRADVEAGRMAVPEGATIGPVTAPPVVATPAQVTGAYNAYKSGRMSPDEMRGYTADVQSGRMQLPMGGDLTPTMAMMQAMPPANTSLASGLDQDAPTSFQLSPMALAGDVATQAIGGVSDAATSVLGLPGTLSDLFDSGMSALTGMPQLPPNPLNIGAMQGYASALTGGLTDQPATTPLGETTRSVAGFMPFAGSRPITQGLIPALTGIAAQGAAAGTGYDQTAGVIGALAGGVGGAALAGGRVAPVPASASRLPAQAVEEAAAPAANAAANVGQIIRTASVGSSRAAQAATAQLAAIADVNKEAMAAAARLGITLPPDVFAQNGLVREAAGLTRSVAGSEASTAWRQSVQDAITAADNAAAVINASPDLSAVSLRVQDSMQATSSALKDQAGALYDQVAAAIPRNAQIQPNNTVRALNDVIGELGGPDGMTAAERSLYQIVTSEQPITYTRILRESADIRRAIERGDGPYGTMAKSDLERLYTALRQDQLDNVSALGSPELADSLRQANALWAQRAELNDRIVNSFGRDLNGSIATRLRTSMASAGRGDISGLRRIIEIIPPELRREAVAAGLLGSTRSTVAGETGFGFAQFRQMYSGLRANSEAYNTVVRELGPEGHQLMRDLYEVSGVITTARANVLTTGKANQALLGGMEAEGVLSRFLHSPGGARAAQAGAGAIGAASGGMAGAALGATITGVLSRGRPDIKIAVGQMFAGQQFQRAISEVATNGVASEAAMRQLSRAPTFRRWARLSGITDPATWLRSAFQAQIQNKDRR